MRGTSPLLLICLIACGGPAPAQQSVERAWPSAPPRLPAYRGRVERFTLAPGGEIDGLLLTDGTEVETPPHLSAEMTAAIGPGDVVTVHGLKAASLPVIQAVTIADERTGRTVVDRGLSAPPGPARPAAGVPLRREGRIRLLLHGLRGEMNGLLLDDGTTIRFDPVETSRLPSAYRPGSVVTAEGEAHASPYGTVIRADAIGARIVHDASGGSP